MARKPFVVDSVNLKASSLHEYQPFQDTHLSNFFGNPKTRRVLEKNGVVTERGEVLVKGKSHLQKVVLPPLAAAPPPMKPSLSTRSLAFKSDPKSSIPRRATKEVRASEGGKLQSSLSKFGVKTLKPMSHEEYLSILQKYVGEKPEATTRSEEAPPKKDLVTQEKEDHRDEALTMQAADPKGST